MNPGPEKTNVVAVNAGENRRRSLRVHRRWLWVLAWALASATLVWFVRTLDWRSTLARVVEANPAWLGLAVLGHFATLPLLTEQWSRLLPPRRRLRWSALWECVTVGMAAMNTLPFGGGHGLAVGMLVARGTTLEGALSLLALEQLCDGAAKLGLLLLALAVAPLPPILQRATWIMAIALIVSFVGLLWVARHPGHAGWMGRLAAKWGHHLEAVRNPTVLVIAVGLSVLAKVGGLVAIYAVQRSLGVELPLKSAPLVLAAVTFATLMAVSPGSLGVFEMAAVAAYRLLGVPAGEAAALAIVQHACFLLPNIAVGYGLMAWRAVRTH